MMSGLRASIELAGVHPGEQLSVDIIDVELIGNSDERLEAVIGTGDKLVDKLDGSFLPRRLESVYGLRKKLLLA